MSCDCYKIGGPWISYDPSCPAHGDEAQRERKEQEEERLQLLKEIFELQETVRRLENTVNDLMIRLADDR